MQQTLERLGVLGPSTVMVDGSGLSTRNRVSARTLLRALAKSRESFAFGPELIAALPLAEVDGTLEKRAAGSKGHLRAKTGLLSDARVTSLSGYAELADGELVVFSIIVNGFGQGARAAMDGVDAFVAELLRHGGETLGSGGGASAGIVGRGEVGWLGGHDREAERDSLAPAS
jgi:D-alanyl-D-alanine carboxypeptidase/D-alanyl-D-alanine-endopeptidase (penicillin-binding protein 4)